MSTTTAVLKIPSERNVNLNKHDSKTHIPGIYKFWYAETDREGNIKDWKIDHKKYIEFIHSLGYRRFDRGNDFFFVRIKNKVIEEVSKNQIKDEVISYIESFPQEYLDKDGISKDKLLSKFYTSPGIYFSEIKLSMLKQESDLVLNTDSKDVCYIYFKNGFVVCSQNGYEIRPYSQLDKYIWKNQIKEREFRVHDDDGMFSKFVFNIAGKKTDRFISLKTIIGYTLHSFYETKLKATNFTDSTISEVAEGRTGKTLLGRGISQIKNLCEISGKNFDPANKHKYQDCRLDTQIVFLNDIRKNFKFENLFNDISDHITVDQKNLHPFNIKAKMLISSNDTFRVEGASAKDRIIEFELAEHYNNTFGPYDEFGVWFFTEWSEEEWFAFDNFMMVCIYEYMSTGVIEAKSINLGKRKQIEHTNTDFVEWMDEKLEKEEIRPEFEYDKKELHNDFLEEYPEYKEDKWLKRQTNFTRYLKIYTSSSDILDTKVIERPGNGKHYIKFHRKGYNRTQLDLTSS